MAQRFRLWVAVGVATVVIGALVGIGWRRPLSAAYRAFRSPELVDGRAAPTHRQSSQPAPSVDLSTELDRQLAADYVETSDQLLLVDDDHDLLDLTPNDLPVPITRRALRYVRFFTADPRGRRIFEVSWRRSGRYRATIEHVLQDAGLPEDLVWVVAVESAFDPQASSPAKAVGLWQLMAATAADRGLTISYWVDERRSLEAATRAAVAHLAELHEELGSWELALAAYNMGLTGLNRAMERLSALRHQRGEAPQRISLSQLAAEGVIPRETVDYGPKITAMALVAANRAHFGLQRLEPDPLLRRGGILVPSETRLSTIARAAGVSTVQLRELNPQLLRDRVPPGADYEVAVPAARLHRALAALPVYLQDEHEQEESSGTPPDPLEPLELGTSDWQAAVARLDAIRSALAVGSSAAIDGSAAVAFSMPALGTPPPAGVKPLQELAGIGFGMRHRRDPLELLSYANSVLGPGWTQARKPATGNPALDKQLAFLREPTVVDEPIGHGITLRLHRDTTMSRVAVTVRLGPADTHAALDGAAVDGVSQPHDGGWEIRQTEVVAPDQLDVGVTVAVGRLGLLIAEAAQRPVAALRSRLNRHRRVALRRLRYGPAWLALSDGLFPEDDPVAGRLVGPRAADAAWLRDRLLLARLAAERATPGATITVVGDIDPGRARRQVEQAVAELGLAFGGAPHSAQPRGRSGHQTIETDVPHERLLIGWRVPGVEHEDHGAVQVAIEILAGPKKSLLNRKLVASDLAVAARGLVDQGWAASVAVLEVTPVLPRSISRVETRIDELMQRLAEQGPTRVELAYAKAMIGFRLDKRAAQLSVAPAPGRARAPLGWRLLETLRPGHTKQVAEAIETVDARAIKRVLSQHLTWDRRQVVVAVPTGSQVPVAQR
ncbi:MAG: hypothetical protein DRI90_13325 [Deltaproteobacteria bacterium]|nr:MAG: hypothetical protein DRI90_13325 [Deltaproteobacteria bacterium]